MKIVSDHPELSKITCLIDANTFKNLLVDHPNQPFIQLVLMELQEGFWPIVDTTMEGYLKIWDVSSRPVKTDKECKFMDSQVTIEIAAGRFLPLFGADLLWGMYSPTVHMVPKQNLSLCGLWLTTLVVSLTSTL